MNVADYGLGGYGTFILPGVCELAARKLATPSVIVMKVMTSSGRLALQTTIPSGSSAYVYGNLLIPPSVPFPYGIAVEPDVH